MARTVLSNPLKLEAHYYNVIFAPARAMNEFTKSHGLGNDYLVFEEKSLSFDLTPEAVRLLCDRRLGLGADGILLMVDSEKSDFGLRIFNPDGSEAEKSGNGLRIFAKFLRERGHAGAKVFSIETPGGEARAETAEKDGRVCAVTVDMGRAVFREGADKITAGGKSFEFTAVSVGNPHCVIFTGNPNPDETKLLGPLIENHEFFPGRANVQFARAVSKGRLEIFIWERGAGYTLASGSSSCAAAAAAVRKGLCGSPLTVAMPGGELSVEVSPGFEIRMTGPAEEVAAGNLSGDILKKLSGAGGPGAGGR